MQRLVASCSKLANTRYVRNPSLPNPNLCDVFISHRRIDTKKTISGLLHDHFTRLHLNSFLDSKSLKPGDRLLFEVNAAIRECSVGIAVFSPRYCDSYFCLHELMRLMENKKRIIPIFCNVKPSELCVKNDRTRPAAEIRRLQLALEEAKYTVGLTFDTSNGYVLGFPQSNIFIYDLLSNICNAYFHCFLTNLKILFDNLERLNIKL